jgi:uroporphyrinogen decarboxylase
MPIKNDLLLRTLAGEKTARPPVWMMRQAGRYLPGFMKLKEKYPFFERVQNPELATEITVMPLEEVGVDAAILFSDILVIPQALEVEVQMVPGKGPLVPHPIRSAEQVAALPEVDAADRLHYVMDAVKSTVKAIDGEVPLIGFAGSPWTILCYMVEGQGSKTFDQAKAFCFSQPQAAHQLLQKITDVTIDYLRAKQAAGCDVIQLFDSWGGLLSPEDYRRYSLPYLKQIAEALAPRTPVILFAKGCWYALEEMTALPVKALGVDWTITPQMAREFTQFQMPLQGNFDPARLLSPIPEIEKMTRQMIQDFGPYKYIANLGHGILPNIPVDHARAFVNTVKSFEQ